jgi:hypothetical protein
MRKIKEVLRLKFEAKLSHEKIAAATGMSKGESREGVGYHALRTSADGLEIDRRR